MTDDAWVLLEYALQALERAAARHSIAMKREVRRKQDSRSIAACDLA